MKVVINRYYGGFGLSHQAVMRYAELSGFQLYPWLDHIVRRVYGRRAVIGFDEITHYYSRVPLADLPLDEHGDPNVPDEAYWSSRDLQRTDPILVRVVEELGPAADGCYAKLRIVEIPDGTEYEIQEYDAEVHRTWWG